MNSDESALVEAIITANQDFAANNQTVQDTVANAMTANKAAFDATVSAAFATYNATLIVVAPPVVTPVEPSPLV